MKIVHISDLHLSTLYKRDNIIKTKKLIKHAVSSGFDHLVITGDISDNCEEKDFFILKKILQNFGLYRSDKTTITIGNHDIFGGVQTAIDVVNFPSKCLKINYNNKVKEFVDYFEELFKETTCPLDKNYFPFVKTLGEIALIGINTIDRYSRIKNPFASNGKIYSEEFDALEKLLFNSLLANKRKIILSHHHFYKNQEEATSSSSMWNKIESYTLKLKGKKKLLKLFKESDVELVLHGHSHEIRDYQRKGVRFINAGGTVDNLSDEASLISLDIKKKISVKIEKILPKTKNSSSKNYLEFIQSLAS